MKVKDTLNELKNFMMRGNVVDLAVGVVVGAAFGKIVSSLVTDIIMPPLGVLLHGVNFVDLKLVLNEASKTATGEVIPAVTLNYGLFIQSMFDFIIIATAIFFFVKLISSLQKKKDEVAAQPAAPSKEEALLTEIRDLLKEQNQKK